MIVDEFSKNQKKNSEMRKSFTSLLFALFVIDKFLKGFFLYIILIRLKNNETLSFCDLTFAWRWSFSNLIDFSDTPIEGSNPTSPTNGEETTVTPNTIRGKGEKPPFGGGSSYYNYPLGNSR